MRASKLYLPLALAIMVMVPSCTCNQMARAWGGSQTIELEPGRRLLNCTFKEDDIWILARKDTLVEPDTLYFYEHSSYGLLQGTVMIVEK